MNRLPSFGPHPCLVYLRLPYMGENSIRLAKQASLAIKSIFNSVSLRVVYNTNRPLNGIVKDATPTNELSNVVYIFKCMLRVVYNTNRPLNGIVKDATPIHDSSNVVYIFKCIAEMTTLVEHLNVSTSGESSMSRKS